MHIAGSPGILKRTSIGIVLIMATAAAFAGAQTPAEAPMSPQQFYGPPRDLGLPEARTYRFQSEWRVPQKSIAVFAAELEKNVRPILQKLMEQGTVTDYGTFMTLVREEEGPTNGYWFGIPTYAALPKALDALAKLPPSALGESAVKQHDYFLRHELRLTRPSAGTNGYYYFNSTLIQPGKQGQWREWWDHYQKPLYERFLADGLITNYEIDEGEMHTMDPNWQYLIWIATSGEALDKMNDAWIARAKRQTAEEKRAMAAELAAVVVAGSHRDYFAHALSYGSK
jgi:hypothetical protein